ncbi:MAG: serine/threonine-protein kinase [Gemmataceae bacterium]|nr:serine/threonine-protein kinase [Gemmataceae bacterium]
MAWNPEANEVFLKALEASSPDERGAYLEQRCGGNAELRAQVQALLDSYARAGGFLQTAAIPPTAEGQTGARSTPDETHANDSSLDFLSPSEQPDSLGRLGHYEVLEVIGKGGMGIVLRAFDDKLRRVVAIKVLAPQLAAIGAARQRFEREARAAAAVRDEHVIGIHAVEEDNGLPFLVMEFIEGVSLQERLDQTGPLDLERIVRIALQTARGLAAAHAAGLMHRDIKPANILLENGVERVKITDFGLARAVDDASLTQSGVVTGTPQYMAPEQARGEPTDHRADLFSFGSVLYVMCAGHPAFRATGSMAVLKRVCEDTPRPIGQVNPQTPEWLAALIDRLHAKDPAERLQSAAELAELLSQHLPGAQPPSAAPAAPLPSPLGRGAAGARRHVAVTAALLLCLLGAFSLSEATGFTNVVPAMIRAFRPQAELVETSGPAAPAAGAAPVSKPLRQEQARQLAEANRLFKLGDPLRGPDPAQAEAHFRKAVAIYEKLQDAPEIPGAKQKLDACRWSLGSALHMQANQIVFRNSAANPEEVQRAVAMGKESVVLDPADKGFWITLGLAHYRAGDWKAACAALEKAEQVPIRSAQVFHEIKTLFPLAMTYWQLGDKTKAGARYRRAAELMEQHQRTEAPLRLLQAEASSLLGK